MYAARCHTGTLAACFLKGSYRSAACDACVGHAACKFVCTGFFLDGIAHFRNVLQHIRRKRSRAEPCYAVQVIACVDLFGPVAQVGGVKPACARYQKLVVTCKQGVFHHDLIKLIGINLCRAEHVNKTVTEAASFAFKKRCDNKRIFAMCEIALFFYSAAVLKLHSARKLDHMNTVFPLFGIVFTQPAFD